MTAQSILCIIIKSLPGTDEVLLHCPNRFRPGYTQDHEGKPHSVLNGLCLSIFSNNLFCCDVLCVLFFEILGCAHSLYFDSQQNNSTCG